MTSPNPVGEIGDELQSALKSEMRLLALAAQRANIVEGVMRVRALSEIGDCLETPELLALAVRITADRQAGMTYL